MRRFASYVLVAGLAFAGASCGSSGKKSVILPARPGLSPVARHATPNRVGPGPFVPSGGFAGGGGSGLWGDGASGPDGTSLGCLNNRHYSDAFGIENRSKAAVTLTAVRGPNPAPRIVDRVATQMRLSPPQRPTTLNNFGGFSDLVYRGWSAARGRQVTIPPGRIATVQSNYLMRNCEDLVHGRTVTLPGWLVLSYRAFGHGGVQKLSLPGRRITLTAGPTRRTCTPVSGSATLVAADIGCAVAREGDRACHPMSHPTFGVCTVAGRLWDCGSFAGAGEPLLETCYLPQEKSHSFRTVWIDRKLGSGARSRTRRVLAGVVPAAVAGPEAYAGSGEAHERSSTGATPSPSFGAPRPRESSSPFASTTAREATGLATLFRSGPDGTLSTASTSRWPARS